MIEILTGRYQQFNQELTQQYDGAELDLGCGNGSFSIELAKLYPNKLIIAVDIKLGRLRKVQRKADRYNLTNIHIIRSLAWDIITYYLPDNFLDRTHILCPDPWPKVRHRHNRLLSSQFIGQLGTKIKSNGIFHFSTDDTFYLKEFQQAINGFKKTFQLEQYLLNDINHIKTDFEHHWNSLGKSVNHLIYQVTKPSLS